MEPAFVVGMENVNRHITMIEFGENGAIDIQLESDVNGRDCVAVKILDQSALMLSSHQARILATELIMAANRAEVRENLRRNENMVRNNSMTDAPRNLFQEAFAK